MYQLIIFEQNTLLPSFMEQCFKLRGPGGERILDIVPGGTELEPQIKTGSWAGRTHSQYSQVKCTGVYCA